MFTKEIAGAAMCFFFRGRLIACCFRTNVPFVFSCFIFFHSVADEKLDISFCGFLSGSLEPYVQSGRRDVDNERDALVRHQKISAASSCRAIAFF